MKKPIFFIALLALVTTSCEPSLEEKAQSFAEIEVKKILNDASSYESVETRVDSAFNTVYINYDACKAACDITEALNKIEDYQREYKREKSSAAIWSDSWSAFSKEEYRQAKEKMASLTEKIQEEQEAIEENKSIIRKANEESKDRKFIGWAISHRFRCANGLGVKSLTDILLISDPKMENLGLRVMLDDKDPQGLQSLTKVIDEVLGE